MSKIVIANVCGAANKGDAALLESLLSYLKECGIHHSDIAGIALRVDMQNDHLPTIRWWERPLTSHKVSKFARRIGNLYLWIVGIAYFLLGFRWILKAFPVSQKMSIIALEKAKLVISCPGGYLEDSNSSYITNCFQLFIAAKARRKIILAPQSIGPVRSRLGKWLIRRLVRSVSIVYARDKASLQCINTLFNNRLPANVFKAGDMALWHQRNSQTETFPQLDKFIANRFPVVGISIIDWNFPNSSSPIAERKKYLEELRKIVDFVGSIGGCCVCVNQVSWDLHIAKELQSLVNPDYLYIDTSEHSATSLRLMIKKCSAFVGSRLHSCIFALLEDVPVIALSYLPKTDGIFEDLGLSSNVRKIDSFSGFEVAESVLKNNTYDGNADRIKQYKNSNDLSIFSKYLTDCQ